MKYHVVKTALLRQLWTVRRSMSRYSFSVTGGVAQPLAVGLRQRDTDRRSITSLVTAPVSDERRRSAQPSSA